MLINYNSFVIFILIFLICITISLILISICEFRTLNPFGSYMSYINNKGSNKEITKSINKHQNKENAIVTNEEISKDINETESLEEFKNDKNNKTKIEVINVENNLILELDGSYEFFTPISDIKKDVFISDNIKLIMLESGKSQIFNDKIKIEAFFYGDSYQIYYRKIK